MQTETQQTIFTAPDLPLLSVPTEGAPAGILTDEDRQAIHFEGGK
jgi:hypothetical protein